MIWLVKDDASYQVTGCNIGNKDGLFQLWVERPNTKSLKVAESADKELIKLHKEAIDHAISIGDPIYRVV